LIHGRWKASFLIAAQWVSRAHEKTKQVLGTKTGTKFKNQISSKKRGQNWGQNPIILLKRNSQWSQKHKKGLTQVSLCSSYH